MSQTTVAIQTVSGGARRVPRLTTTENSLTSSEGHFGYGGTCVRFGSAHGKKRRKIRADDAQTAGRRGAERVAERDGLTHGRRENRRLNRRTPPLHLHHIPSTGTRRHRYPAAKPCIMYKTVRDDGGGDTATPPSGSLQEPLDRRRRRRCTSVKTPSVVARLFITINTQARARTHTRGPMLRSRGGAR